MSEFLKKQEIEKFHFEKGQRFDYLRHKLDNTIKELKKEQEHYGEYYYDNSLEPHIINLLKEILSSSTLVFPFGKYKDYPIEMILEKDKEYCEWYVRNVRGTDYFSLQIIDFLCKKLFGRNDKETYYYFANPETELQRILNIIPMNIISKISTQDILDNIYYKEEGFESNFDNLVSPEEDNEFNYYGDLCLDYEDTY